MIKHMGGDNDKTRVIQENRVKTSSYSFKGILILVLLWLLFSIFIRVVLDKPIPYPWEVITSLVSQPNGEINFIIHSAVSLYRWLIGYTVASVIGILLGLLMWRYKNLNGVLSPLISIIQIIPGVAWIPIALILFGLGNSSTIFMITMTVLAPVVLNTLTGIEQINPTFFRLSSMLELPEKTLFTKIIIPGAAPSIISGLRIGAANGFRVLISAEMVTGTSLGLGYRLYQSRWNLDYPSAFASLLIIIVIGLLLEHLIFRPLEESVLNKRGLTSVRN